MMQSLVMISSVVNRLSKCINQVCWAVAGAFMLAMLIAVAIQVVARYVFFSPPSWTEELARYCMIWAGYLGATVAFYRYEDPVLMERKIAGPGTLSAFFLIVRSSAVLLFMLPILYWSPVIIQHHMVRETESMEIISGYVMLIVPLFSAVILLHVIAQTIAGLTRNQGS